MKKSATCEARTHDLQIMRLTRCRLRQGGSCAEALYLPLLYCTAQARPPMDLFKAIFAESSSSESEAEAQQEEETSPPRPREAAGTQKEEASVVDQGSRKTRWQDLSAVTSGPLTTAADNSSHSNSGKMAPTISEGAAAPLRETAHNGENTALENAGEKQTFGPALPPGRFVNF